MKGFKQYILFVLIIMIFITPVLNAEEIMKIEDVKGGMQGKGKTVFHGFKVEEFPVEIMEIVENQGAVSNLILIKAGGDKIEKIGGIAGGMSGSPIYIDGKLIGAVAYGWQLSDHRYAMVTPIEDMLKLLDGITASDNDPERATALKTPIYTGGLDGRAFKRLKRQFEEMGFRVLQSGLKNKDKGVEGPSLEPGSALAIQLVRGDINIASLGTLTYIDDEQNILAFGHPFFNKGDVDYLLSQAYINGVIPSLEFPFKLGSPTDKVIGSVIRDRGAGIAGQLNEFPRIIPLQIEVKDSDRSVEDTVNVQLVKDEDIITSLVTNVSLQAIDSTLDRIGKGTARVNFKITANGLPDFNIERENFFYSRNDIAAVALYELYRFVNMLTTNPFQKINLIDLKLDVQIEDRDNVALVQEAEVLNDEIGPGDEVEIDVTLRPYRQEPFTRQIKLKLPEDITPGMATLVINGGFSGESYETIPETGNEIGDEEGENRAVVTGYKDFDSILEDYLNEPKNNELILQVYPGYPVAQMKESAAEEDTEDGKETDDGYNRGKQEEIEEDGQTPPAAEVDEEEEIKKTVATDYVLEGSLNIDLNIVGEDSEGEAPPAEEEDSE